MMDKKTKTGLIVFLVVLAAALVCSVSISRSVPEDRDAIAELQEKNETKEEKASSSARTARRERSTRSSSKSKRTKRTGAYIARVDIVGTIEESNSSYNQHWLLETIKELSEDEDNKGIILYVDSPGGGVYEADDAYLALLEYKRTKPVYCYMGPLAASGGYYISCAADYIMANRNTLTGSIGVIAGQFIDITELMEKYGVKSETIHAGRNKNMGNYNEAVTDEQRAIMQAIADECYDQFTGIVAERRNLPLQTVRTLADGRIYTAAQAKRHKLIDDIGSWDNLVELMTEKVFGGTSYEVESFAYKQQESFYNYFLGGSAEIGKALTRAQSPLPQTVEQMIVPQIPYPAYYCPQGRKR